MRTRLRRKLWITVLAAGMILPGVSCVSTDTASALADLASSTTGSLVEILVKNYLDSRLPGASDPNLSAPISQQHK
jgi:hypothetical protein